MPKPWGRLYKICVPFSENLNFKKKKHFSDQSISNKEMEAYNFWWMDKVCQLLVLFKYLFSRTLATFVIVGKFTPRLSNLLSALFHIFTYQNFFRIYTWPGKWYICMMRHQFSVWAVIYHTLYQSWKYFN